MRRRCPANRGRAPSMTRSTASLLLVSVLVLGAVPVWAQESPRDEPTESRAARTQPVLSVDLRPEYLAGEPILIRFDLSNPTQEKTSFADLSSRPHLVRFELTDPNGKTQVRFNTPPKQDPKKRWELGPRGRRQVLLQIPSSAIFKPGTWSLTIRILDDAGERVLPAHSFVLATPRPVAGALVHDALGSERAGHQTIWLHRARQGYDLYLHHSPGKRPQKTLGNSFLVHLDEPIEPVLTHSRPLDRSGRFVTWQVDPRTIAALQLDGKKARGGVRTFQVPWPKVTLLGRGGTDAQGGLHIPIWVPAPRGSGGEIRIASLHGQQGTHFRSVARLSRPPAWVESTIDASGALRLLIAHDGFLDLYTVGATSDLPAVGQRLDVEIAPKVARFGHLPDQDDIPGGLTILGLTPTPEGLVGQWINLNGQTVHRYVPVQPPAGGTLVDLLPRGLAPFAAVYQPKEGPAVLVTPGRTPQTLQGKTDGILFASQDEEVFLRRLAPGGPIETRQLWDGAL